MSSYTQFTDTGDKPIDGPTVNRTGLIVDVDSHIPVIDIQQGLDNDTSVGENAALVPPAGDVDSDPVMSDKSVTLYWPRPTKLRHRMSFLPSDTCDFARDQALSLLGPGMCNSVDRIYLLLISFLLSRANCYEYT